MQKKRGFSKQTAMAAMGHERTFVAAASNDRFVAATGHWKLIFGSLSDRPKPRRP
jgi:hypothetical protein